MYLEVKWENNRYVKFRILFVIKFQSIIVSQLNANPKIVLVNTPFIFVLI